MLRIVLIVSWVHDSPNKLIQVTATSFFIFGYTRGTHGGQWVHDRGHWGTKKATKKATFTKRRHWETDGGHWGTLGYKKGDMGLINYDKQGSDVLRT